jgi:uncharacterized protein (DUF1015 family)
VYCLYRPRRQVLESPDEGGETLYRFQAHGQDHELHIIRDPGEIEALTTFIESCDLYVADGHHRYETALAYRDERLKETTTWTNAEAENFMLMALTAVDDPGLLVLPTHRLVHRAPSPSGEAAITARFEVQAISVEEALARRDVSPATFIEIRDGGRSARLLTLRDREGLAAAMPAERSQAWKSLDVNVLQYGVLNPLFHIEDSDLAETEVVTYTQSHRDALSAAIEGRCAAAYIVPATPIEQMLAVSDAGERMPQKSTYFYPKLPTGLVLNALD